MGVDDVRLRPTGGIDDSWEVGDDPDPGLVGETGEGAGDRVQGGGEAAGPQYLCASDAPVFGARGQFQCGEFKVACHRVPGVRPGGGEVADLLVGDLQQFPAQGLREPDRGGCDRHQLASSAI